MNFYLAYNASDCYTFYPNQCAPGYGQKQNNNLDISAEPGRQELDTVELKPANLKLAGQVLDADDKPVAGCYVNLYGEDQPNANTRTDHDGRFSFAHVCEGTIRLSANAATRPELQLFAR